MKLRRTPDGSVDTVNRTAGDLAVGSIFFGTLPSGKKNLLRVKLLSRSENTITAQCERVHFSSHYPGVMLRLKANEKVKVYLENPE